MLKVTFLQHYIVQFVWVYSLLLGPMKISNLFSTSESWRSEKAKKAVNSYRSRSSNLKSSKTTTFNFYMKIQSTAPSWRLFSRKTFDFVPSVGILTLGKCQKSTDNIDMTFKFTFFQHYMLHSSCKGLNQQLFTLGQLFKKSILFWVQFLISWKCQNFYWHMRISVFKLIILQNYQLEFFHRGLSQAPKVPLSFCSSNSSFSKALGLNSLNKVQMYNFLFRQNFVSHFFYIQSINSTPLGRKVLQCYCAFDFLVRNVWKILTHNIFRLFKTSTLIPKPFWLASKYYHYTKFGEKLVNSEISRFLFRRSFALIKDAE